MSNWISIGISQYKKKKLWKIVWKMFVKVWIIQFILVASFANGEIEQHWGELKNVIFQEFNRQQKKFRMNYF